MKKSCPSKGPKLPADRPASPAARDSLKVAVALGPSSKSKPTPKVLAGGCGAIAEQILNIGLAQDVRVRKDADLAQLLTAVDVASELPVQAFAAVAEILLYVWRANGAAAGDNPLGPDLCPWTQPSTSH